MVALPLVWQLLLGAFGSFAAKCRFTLGVVFPCGRLLLRRTGMRRDRQMAWLWGF